MHTSFDATAAAQNIAARHGIALADLLSRSRRYSVVRARHELMWTLRETGLSYPRIARWLAMDHTGVMHGVRKHAERMAHAAGTQLGQEQESAEPPASAAPAVEAA